MGRIILFVCVVMLVALSGRKDAVLPEHIAYQFLMACGLCAVLLAVAMNEWRLPGRMPYKYFVNLGILPSLVQMGLMALAPQLFWVNTICFVALYILLPARGVTAEHLSAGKDTAPADAKREVPRLNVSNKVYFWVFMLCVPVFFLNWRMFFPVFSLWCFAVWCFQEL